jgi:mannosidase alpha-like ER degradation enhancer 2
MNHKATRFFIISLSLLITITAPSFAQKFTEQEKQQQCERIKEACRHAWQGYLKYAMGYDELRPLSERGHNWYAQSLLFTPVDAFDTFILMGMPEEAEVAKALILHNLDFARDMEVQVFEVNIRSLGGLLSAYELSGERKFLDLAIDLAGRLLPAFRSHTGLPYRYVNLLTLQARGEESNPAEIGTYLLEFGKITYYTGDSSFYKSARSAALAVYKLRSKLNLVGTVINVNSAQWANDESQIGARIDSYYEYLLKSWLMFGDKSMKKAWDVSKAAIIKNLVRETPHGTFMTRVNRNTGRETRSYYGALDAFCAGMMALDGNIPLAGKLQQGNYYMWKKFNLEPEQFDFKTDSIITPYYVLRPENLESCFYLYRFTKDEQYLRMGKEMLDDILEHCKTPSGFAALRDVRNYKQDDSMESFFFAETLKYAYLLFAPESTVDLNKVVFNTEAHPLKRVKGE